VNILSDNLYTSFAGSLISLVPGFPMDAAGVVGHIKTQGLDSIIAIAGNYDPEIFEFAELLIRHGKGGMPNGEG